MTGESILTFLRANKPRFQKDMGVKNIGLFGSYAKGLASENSDVDIFVEMEKPDFQKLMALQFFLEQHLSKPVDLLRKGPHLRPRFLQLIESEIIYA
jgi:predicted nucleotidyltransferase